MQQYSVYSADRFYHQHFGTSSLTYVFPACGLQMILEWGREPARIQSDMDEPAIREEKGA